MNDAKVRPQGLQPFDRILADRKCVGDIVNHRHITIAFGVEETSDIGHASEKPCGWFSRMIGMPARCALS